MKLKRFCALLLALIMLVLCSCGRENTTDGNTPPSGSTNTGVPSVPVEEIKLSLDEIAEMETWADNRINEKKEILAYELTKLVHGEEEASKAKEASHAIFAGGASENMPTTEVDESAFADGKIGILDLLLLAKLAPSRSEAKRLVVQGGVFAADEKVASFSQTFEKAAFAEGLIVRKGKKVYHRFILK